MEDVIEYERRHKKMPKPYPIKLGGFEFLIKPDVNLFARRLRSIGLMICRSINSGEFAFGGR